RNFHYQSGLQFLFIGLSHICPASQQDVFGKSAQRCEFFFAIFNRFGSAQDHDRPVVHRVIKNGTCQDKTIQQSDGDTYRYTLIEVAKHAARGGAVDVKVISYAAVAGRDHKRLSIHLKPNVTDKAFVEDLVSNIAIVDATLRLADNPRARGGRVVFRHVV